MKEFTEQELAELEVKLGSATNISITSDGELYSPEKNEIKTIEHFRILKGNYNVTVIYYEFNKLDPDYIIFKLEDFGKTWGFVSEDIITWRENFLKEIEELSPIEKFVKFSSKETDPREKPELEKSLMIDLSKIK